MAQEASSASASAFPLPEIPVKLRCTICKNLARDAYRLSCCEQSICGECHSSLPEVCPVCEHTPLMKDDCKPNTSLRTTVTVFLRTAEKKHMMAKEKDQKAAAAAAAAGKQEDLSSTKTPTSPIKTIAPFQKQAEHTETLANEGANGNLGTQEHPKGSEPDNVFTSAGQDGAQGMGYQGTGVVDPSKGWDPQTQGFNGAAEWNNYNQAMMNQNPAWNYNPAMMGYQTPEMMAMMNQPGGYGMGAYGMGRGYAGQAGYGWNNGMNNWNQGYPAMGGNMGRGMNNGYVSAGGYRQQSHQQFPHQPFHKYGQHNTYRQAQAHHGMTNGPQGNVHEAGFKPADLKPADWTSQDNEANAPQHGVNETTTEETSALNTGDANPEVNGSDNLVTAENLAQPSANGLQNGDFPSGIKSEMKTQFGPGAAPQAVHTVHSTVNIPVQNVNETRPPMLTAFPGRGRGGYRGRGGFQQHQPHFSTNANNIPVVSSSPVSELPMVDTKGVEGAPKAPRALREGGRWNPRFGRGGGPGSYSRHERVNSNFSGHESRGRSRTRSPADSRGRDRSRGRSMDDRSRSRSRSRSVIDSRTGSPIRRRGRSHSRTRLPRSRSRTRSHSMNRDRSQSVDNYRDASRERERDRRRKLRNSKRRDRDRSSSRSRRTRKDDDDDRLLAEPPVSDRENSLDTGDRTKEDILAARKLRGERRSRSPSRDRGVNDRSSRSPNRSRSRSPDRERRHRSSRHKRHRSRSRSRDREDSPHRSRRHRRSKRDKEERASRRERRHREYDEDPDMDAATKDKHHHERSDSKERRHRERMERKEQRRAERAERKDREREHKRRRRSRSRSRTRSPARSRRDGRDLSPVGILAEREDNWSRQGSSKRRKERSPSRDRELNGRGFDRRHKKSRSEDKGDYYTPKDRHRPSHDDSKRERELFERPSKHNGVLSDIDEKEDTKHRKRTPEPEPEPVADSKPEKPVTKAPEKESTPENPDKENTNIEPKPSKEKSLTPLEKPVSIEEKSRTSLPPHLEPAEGQDAKQPRRRAQIKYETQGLERKAEKLREAERWITGGGRSSRR